MRRILMIVFCAAIIFSMAGCAQLEKLTAKNEIFEPQPVYVENRFNRCIVSFEKEHIVLAPEEFKFLSGAFRSGDFLALASSTATADSVLQTAVSSNGGKQWTKAKIDVTHMAQNRYIALERVQFLTPNDGFLMVSFPKDIAPWQTNAFFTTQDGGKTWSTPVRQNFDAADMIAVSKTELWAACGKVLRHTTDGGKTWLDVPIPVWINGHEDITAYNFFYYDGAWHLKGYQTEGDRILQPCYYRLQCGEEGAADAWVADKTCIAPVTVLPENQEYIIQKPDPASENYEYDKQTYNEFMQLSRKDLDTLWARACQLLHEYKISARPGVLPPPETDGLFDTAYPAGVLMFETLDPSQAVFVPHEGMWGIWVGIPVAEGVTAQVTLGGMLEPDVPAVNAMSAYFVADNSAARTPSAAIETAAYTAINEVLDAYRNGTIAKMPYDEMSPYTATAMRWPMWPKDIDIPKATPENTTMHVYANSVYAVLTTLEEIQINFNLIPKDTKDNLTLPFLEYHDASRLENLMINTVNVWDNAAPTANFVFVISDISPDVMCQVANRVFIDLTYQSYYQIGGKTFDAPCSVSWNKTDGFLSAYVYDQVINKQLFSANYDIVEDKMRDFSSEEIDEATALDFMQKLFKDVQRIDAELIP